jgi:hypothetical protein
MQFLELLQRNPEFRILTGAVLRVGSGVAGSVFQRGEYATWGLLVRRHGWRKALFHDEGGTGCIGIGVESTGGQKRLTNKRWLLGDGIISGMWLSLNSWVGLCRPLSLVSLVLVWIYSFLPMSTNKSRRKGLANRPPRRR